MAQEVIKFGKKVWTDWEVSGQTNPPTYKRHLDFNKNYIALMFSNSYAGFMKRDLWNVLFCGSDDCIAPIAKIHYDKFSNIKYKLEDLDLFKRDVDSILIKYNKLLIFT